MGETDILHGVMAYAFKQADIAQWMALRCGMDWLPELHKAGIKPQWANKFSCNTVPRMSVHANDALEDIVDDNDDVDMVESASEGEDDSDDVDEFEFDD